MVAPSGRAIPIDAGSQSGRAIAIPLDATPMVGVSPWGGPGHVGYGKAIEMVEHTALAACSHGKAIEMVGRCTNGQARGSMAWRQPFPFPLLESRGGNHEDPWPLHKSRGMCLPLGTGCCVEHMIPHDSKWSAFASIWPVALPSVQLSAQLQACCSSAYHSPAALLASLLLLFLPFSCCSSFHSPADLPTFSCCSSCHSHGRLLLGLSHSALQSLRAILRACDALVPV